MCLPVCFADHSPDSSNLLQEPNARDAGGVSAAGPGTVGWVPGELR